MALPVAMDESQAISDSYLSIDLLPSRRDLLDSELESPLSSSGKIGPSPEEDEKITAKLLVSRKERY